MFDANNFIRVIEDYRDKLIQFTKNKFKEKHSRIKYVCPRKITNKFASVIKEFDEFDDYNHN